MSLVSKLQKPSWCLVVITMYFWPACLASLAQSRAALGLGLNVLGELLVFGHRDAFVFHDPLVAAQHAVEAPVDEHAEAGFMPPLHAAFAVGVASGGGGGAVAAAAAPAAISCR